MFDMISGKCTVIGTCRVANGNCEEKRNTKLYYYYTRAVLIASLYGLGHFEHSKCGKLFPEARLKITDHP
jgi:hypothetical protein